MRRYDTGNRYYVVVAAMLVALTSNWAASAISGETLFKAWWPQLSEYPVVSASLFSVLFILSTIWLYNAGRAFFSIKSFSEGISKPSACLIIPISSSNHKTETEGVFTFTTRAGDVVNVPSKNGLKADIAALEKIKKDSGNTTRWAWQQLLTCLLPHERTLRKIYLIGSEGTKDKSGQSIFDGSFGDLKAAESLIRSYKDFFSKDVSIECFDSAVNFENFGEIKNAIESVIISAKKAGFKNHEIVVDITGGQKTTSIAAAAVTLLHGDIQFQYVKTNPEQYDDSAVRSYNVEVVPPSE